MLRSECAEKGEEKRVAGEEGNQSWIGFDAGRLCFDGKINELEKKERKKTWKIIANSSRDSRNSISPWSVLQASLQLWVFISLSDRPFHNLRDSKSGNRIILISSRTSSDGCCKIQNWEKSLSGLSQSWGLKILRSADSNSIGGILRL